MKSFLVDQDGYYGEFGGAYVPEILHKCVEELHTDCRLPAGPHLFLTRIRRRTDPQAGAGGGHPVATQIQRLYTYNGFHRTESH